MKKTMQKMETPVPCSKSGGWTVRYKKNPWKKIK